MPRDVSNYELQVLAGDPVRGKFLDAPGLILPELDAGEEIASDIRASLWVDRGGTGEEDAMLFLRKDADDVMTFARVMTGAASQGFAPVFNVKDVDFGATGDGATDDTVAIQDAIDAANTAGGGIVHFPPGVYLTGTLILKSFAHLIGSGRQATILKLKAGTNADLIQGEDWDDLTGSTPANEGEAGIRSFSLRHMTLDGNKANNTAGSGLRFFGYAGDLNDLRVVRCDDNGIHSEWTNPGGVITDMSAMRVTDLSIEQNGGYGIYWDGQHDCQFSGVFSFLNGIDNIHTTTKAPGCQFTNSHAWGDGVVNAWYIGGTGTVLVNVVGEGADVQCYVDASHVQIAGGYFYGAGVATPKGIKLGTAVTTEVAACHIQAHISDCESGSVDFANETWNVLDLSIHLAAGTYYVGSPDAATTVRVRTTGLTNEARVEGVQRFPDRLGLGTNPATTGVLGIPNNQGIYARNAANDDNLRILVYGSDNALYVHWNNNLIIGNADVQINAVPLLLTDGITAPSATAGFAKMYVDTADGDLKIRFGDGTIKTIVVDT